MEELGAVELADEVGLLVTELIGNVVLHARTTCTVTVVRTGDRMRVEVADGSARLPSPPRSRDPMAQSGRGMQLVDRMAAAHGVVDRGDAGKTVWFELVIGDDDGT